MGNSCTKKPKTKKLFKLIPTNQIGLTNLGNSCYINSIIHSLQGIPKIYSEMILLNPTRDSNITYCLAKILHALNENDPNRYERYINRIKKVMLYS